ncbi:MAG: glycosyltransferase family 4 protein [Alphaproteobacteria bacterium]|nr:glycosyltransferase family 4 protein [Alphaproteobacteria bacterium]
MIFSLFITLSAFLIALIGTRLLILAFRGRRMMLDLPNARSNHQTPVPKGGGLAVVFALIIPMLVANIELAIVLSVLILAAVSLLDDLITVPPLVRLLVQVIAVAIPLSILPIDFSGGLLPPMVEKTLVGIMWIWCINLFNFMDGADGLSAVEMISVGLGITFIMVFAEQFPGELAHYAMVLAAAGCGFWWWNRHPAKIFLGDVGSIPIGFIIGYLLLLTALSGYPVAALILPGYYFADATITIIKRLLKREKIWQAHSSHYYQQAMRKGWKHGLVTQYIAGVNVLLGFLAVYSALYPDLNFLFIALAVMAVFMLMGFFRHHPGDSTTGTQK